MGELGGLLETRGREARVCCLDAALVRVATGCMASCADESIGSLAVAWTGAGKLDRGELRRREAGAASPKVAAGCVD